MGRKRAEKYIHDTPDGIRAQIRIRGVLHRKRWKPGTPRSVAREWLMRTQLKFRGTTAKRTGKFADDAAAYLDAVKAMPSYAERERHINEWIAVFGTRQRDSITSDEIAAQLQRWRQETRAVAVARNKAGEVTKRRAVILSASAVNHRRTALQHLYRVLDGKAASNPVKDVPKFREPDALPKGLPYEAITALWAVMRDNKTRARLQVIAYTGIPHKQVQQITAADVNYAAGTVLVPGRHKGRGTMARVIPLTPDGVRAFEAMRRTDAWGPFSNSQLRRDFRAACAKVPMLKSIAETLTPYDLRHSFGTEVYRQSGDIRATQVLMGHSTPLLTHRYTLAAVDPRLVQALEGFGRPGTLRDHSPSRNVQSAGTSGKQKRILPQ
jgi:integrase